MLGNHRKACLPNYRVFDEKRYFTPGTGSRRCWSSNGIKAGVLVCEDVWEPEPGRAQRDAPPAHRCCWSSMRRPTRWTSRVQRELQVVGRSRVEETGIPLVFLNLIGGQDELVFDGNSFVMNAAGQVTQRAPAFVPRECTWSTSRQTPSGRGDPRASRITSSRCRARRRACMARWCKGTRDYVEKHRFPGVVLGLVRRHRFGVDAVHRGGCALGAEPGALGGDAVALHLADEQGRCRRSRPGSCSRSSTAKSPSRGCSRPRSPRSRTQFAGRAAGYGGGEHPVTLPRRAADGDFEQDRPHAA